MAVPIGYWGLGFAPTDYVAHYCFIGHYVGIMAAHGMSQMVVFATSHPTHLTWFHPTMPPIPPTHPSLLSMLTAERDGKKYHKIQPLEIEKVSYNKN